jgi:epoxyqueuosine reductase
MLHSADIKQQALALGFSHAGIARTRELDQEIARFDEWCRRGHDATMGWMRKRREERRDIGLVVPGAQSVVVVAMNYAPPGEYIPDSGGVRVSRYAHGDDYHEVVGVRLERLLDWMLREVPGSDGRVYVDTGPVLEKAWASLAGIGWQGKHTNVITRDRGSWVFLGVIITTLKLDPDTPVTDMCGTCTRCIDACPTRAIVEPYVLDARRCIS